MEQNHNEDSDGLLAGLLAEPKQASNRATEGNRLVSGGSSSRLIFSGARTKASKKRARVANGPKQTNCWTPNKRLAREVAAAREPKGKRKGQGEWRHCFDLRGQYHRGIWRRLAGRVSRFKLGLLAQLGRLICNADCLSSSSSSSDNRQAEATHSLCAAAARLLFLSSASRSFGCQPAKHSYKSEAYFIIMISNHN